jgi:hypothetical protein
LRIYLYIFISLITLLSCRKQFSAIYAEQQGPALTNDSSLCTPNIITSRNLGAAEETYEITYDSIRYGFAKQVKFISAPLSTNAMFLKIKLNDTVFLWNKDTVFLDRINRQVKRMKIMPNTVSSDTLTVKLQYDSSYLAKKYIYLNGDTIPSFQSDYSYDSRQRLVKINMQFYPDQSVIYTSEIAYDETYQVKPWLYVFTDFFHLDTHLLGFNFGKRSQHLIKKITQTFYSSFLSNAIGISTIEFSRYQLSKDGYVTDFSCNGPRLNSTTYFYQNVQLKYVCK